MDLVGEHRALADALVSNLEGLRGDRAALARLRRCAGRPLGESKEVFSLFYRLLPAEARGRDWVEERCFLVATLYPLAPETSAGDLGQSLRNLVRQLPNQASGVERRLGILLDASPDELPFRLRQAVTLLAGRGIGVDWRQLLVDLLEWDWANQPAQKRWARSYFGGEAEPEAPAAATGTAQA